MRGKIRKLAESRLLNLGDIARKKSSRGICFIGKRPFGEFVAQFLEPKKGYMIDVSFGAKKKQMILFF